jgi:hypothetical protein
VLGFSCGKYLRKKNQLGGRIYFGSWFQRFQSMVGQLNCFQCQGETEDHGREHMVEQKYLMEAIVWEVGRRMTRPVFKAIPPVTYFLCSVPTFQFLPLPSSQFRILNPSMD